MDALPAAAAAGASRGAGEGAIRITVPRMAIRAACPTFTLYHRTGAKLGR